MCYFIEEWKHRPAWIAMSPEDRGKFLFDLAPVIQRLVDEGAELLGYCVDGAHHGDMSRFLRIWRVPDQGFAGRIEAALAETGWHTFFEPGESRGEVLTPQVAIHYLVNPNK